MNSMIEQFMSVISQKKSRYDCVSEELPPSNLENYNTVHKMQEFISTIKFYDDEADFNDLITFIEKSHTENSTDFVYRGHGDASWRISSTYWRDWNKSSSFAEYESSRFEELKHNLDNCNELKLYADNDQQLLCAAQHYGFHSSLIDVTYSPLIALFFVTSDFEKSGCNINEASKLKDYIALFQLKITSEFCNYEETRSASVSNLNEAVLSSADSTAINSLNDSPGLLQDSVISELQQIAHPVIVSPSFLRVIENKRSDAQRGAFVYLGKYSDRPLEEAFERANKKFPGEFVANCFLINRKYIPQIKDLLAKHNINHQTMYF